MNTPLVLKYPTKASIYVCISVMLLVLVGCKSAKTVMASNKINPKLSAKQVTKAHLKNTTNFKTLQARAKIDMTQGETSQGFTFNFRIQKDSVIWLSAPLGAARLKITPQSVQFYNKLDKTYFDGNYSLLSNVVGFELDFSKVQNILLGQAIYNLKAKPHSVDIQDQSYVLQPKHQDVALELFYLIHPSHFKLNSLQLAQPAKQRILQVDYNAYQNVDAQVLPKVVEIVAVEGTDQVLINLELKSVLLDTDVRFPFKIPSGYNPIEI